MFQHLSRPNRNRHARTIMAKSKIRPIRVEGNIAYVPLTQGYEAVIDADDVPLVVAFNWSAHKGPNTVYASRNSRKDLGEADGKCFLLHRVIMNAEPGKIVDHRDGDGLNNRRENLRFATKAENGRNSRIRKQNASGFKGVFLHKQSGKWRARISTGDRHVCLGLHPTPEAAHEAYVKASAELHGEFGRTH